MSTQETMDRPGEGRRRRRPSPGRGVLVPVNRRLTVLLAVLLSLVMAAAPAVAYWSAVGSGHGTSATGTLQPPTAVTATSVGGGSVAVSWTASAGTPSPSGYHVDRVSENGTTPACGTGLIAGTSCTDVGIGDGTYTYVVTAVHYTWTAVGQASDAVAVLNPAGGPALAEASSYSVLGGTGVTSTGATSVSGDLGVSPSTSVVGFGIPAGSLGTVGGTIHAGDAEATAAQVAFAAAYADLDAHEPDPNSAPVFAGDPNGLTFAPGTYHSSTAITLTGDLTLDAGGDPDALFIFGVDAALSAAAGSRVLLTGGALASNVFWRVLGAVDTGASSAFAGTILAHGAITLGAGAELIGRALTSGTVTMAANTIRFTTALPPTLSIDGGPTRATKDVTPEITGSTDAAAGRTVTVTVGGQVLPTTVETGGAWSVTATDLTAGTYTVLAAVKDGAGNGSNASQVLTVEVNPAPVMLGAAAPFAVLAETTVTSTGATTVGGDLGLAPAGTLGGFPPGTVDGTIYLGDTVAVAAMSALSTALDDAEGRTPHTEFAGDLGGRTFHVGVHETSAALALTGTLTLDGEGDPAAVFIFQVDAALNTTAGSTILLVNGAQASNVFWVVTGAVGTGAASSFAGTILARGAITLGSGTQLAGRALSRGAVTLADNIITGTPQ